MSDHGAADAMDSMMETISELHEEIQRLREENSRLEKRLALAEDAMNGYKKMCELQAALSPQKEPAE